MWKRVLVVAALFASVCAVAAAQRAARSFEKVTVGTVAVSLSNGTINPDNRPTSECAGSVEIADIRVRIDGTAATGTTGELLYAGGRLQVVGSDNIRRLSMIRDASAEDDAVVNLTCY